MIVTKSALLIGTVAVLIVATLARTQPQQDESLPPGVSEENWIPLSSSAGLLVTGVRAGVQRPGNEPAEETFRAARGTGVLMARHQDQWIVFEEVTSPGLRIRPLQQ